MRRRELPFRGSGEAKKTHTVICALAAPSPQFPLGAGVRFLTTILERQEYEVLASKEVVSTSLESFDGDGDSLINGIVAPGGRAFLVNLLMIPTCQQRLSTGF